MLQTAFVGTTNIRSVCAIFASKKSLIQDKKHRRDSRKNIFGKCSHCILEGNSYIEGNYLKFERLRKNAKVCKEMDKIEFSCNTGHPLANYSNLYHINNNDFCNVTSQVQHKSDVFISKRYDSYFRRSYHFGSTLIFVYSSNKHNYILLFFVCVILTHNFGLNQN